MSKPGERRLGKWLVGHRIGRGGQARVFEATSGEASEVFAIKPISTTATKKGARFKQEVEQHARLSSEGASNVIPVVDFHIEVHEDGATNGYIVMPRAHANLDEVASTFEGRLELSLDTFLGIVRGVRAAHDRGVIHRDLKPANVLFLDPALREPLVSDFGICLLKDARREDRLTDVGETVGARFYKAPEQERGGVIDVTEAADVYALGKILHFMLTGRNLYREELSEAFTPEELGKDPRLAVIRNELLARMVVTDPNLRLQTAAELLTLVEDLIARFRGGPTSGGQPAHPADQQVENPLVSTEESRAESVDSRQEDSYAEAVREILKGNAQTIALRFDSAKRGFDKTWDTVRTELKPSRESLVDGAVTIVTEQRELSVTLLAIARFDTEALFQELSSYLEYILKSSEAIVGDRRVRSVAHLTAGFQYMTAAVAAVARNAWNLLDYLLNLKVEWYYESGRPLFSYALDLSYFFHPESLERKATAAHDLYLSLLNGSGFGRFLGKQGDDLTTWYVQAQFLMCIKAAQLNEAGNTDVDPFAYFGRYYDDRLIPLLTRMEHNTGFAQGVTRAFGETSEDWFLRLPGRLALARKWFDHAHFDWASLRGWPE
jgi:serine/threonine protein kinase